MELTWYGAAALTVREGECTLALDPFAGIRPGELKRPPAHLPFEDSLRGVSGVLVTHGHFDHIAHIPRLYGGTPVPVWCTAAPAATLTARGFPAGQLRAIGPGWEGRIGPFAIRAFQGRHCRFDAGLVLRTVLSRRFFRHPGHTARLLALDRAFPERGEILFFEVSCRGTRLQIMGSMGLAGDVDYPTGADGLVLPLQGRSDQDVYALELVRRLMPKMVILDHWDNAFEPMTGQVDPSGFVQNLRRELDIPCVVLTPGERTGIEAVEG